MPTLCLWGSRSTPIFTHEESEWFAQGSLEPTLSPTQIAFLLTHRCGLALSGRVAGSELRREQDKGRLPLCLASCPESLESAVIY